MRIGTLFAELGLALLDGGHEEVPHRRRRQPVEPPADPVHRDHEQVLRTSTKPKPLLGQVGADSHSLRRLMGDLLSSGHRSEVSASHSIVGGRRICDKIQLFVYDEIELGA